ncbi:MAG: rubrerythrin, partial [Desulfobacula sp.]|nr:rubrerythrin [Desulfobacula sp.]
NNENHKKFLLDLAAMEDDHVVTFLNMQKELTKEKIMAAGFDPEDENLAYLKALADTRVFFKKEQPDDSFQSILTTAIQTEKDSIAFYLGMKELVPAKLGQAKIDDIIKEEMSHIRIIAEKLKE